ncbi:hypothetical protein PM082_012476 [Marasmius tenuissimus]|nr:hypothetical protein PM082_012476 [Marasmius tenuissimus]
MESFVWLKCAYRKRRGNRCRGRERNSTKISCLSVFQCLSCGPWLKRLLVYDRYVHEGLKSWHDAYFTLEERLLCHSAVTNICSFEIPTVFLEPLQTYFVQCHSRNIPSHKDSPTSIFNSSTSTSDTPTFRTHTSARGYHCLSRYA